MSSRAVDVVIIGAGPYGLSLASHLTDRGVARRIFGIPMIAWRQMPPGMYLKSFGFATSIPTPYANCTLPEYCRARGLEDFEPIPTATYADYGEWFQQKLVPDLERVLVIDVTRHNSGFHVTLETGERIQARRVIVAAGLGHFTRVPEALSSLPPGTVTHTNKTAEYLRTAQYAGRDITVIGAGQSALEAATLLHEGGARVRIVARQTVEWSTPFSERSLRDKLLHPNSVVGPGRKSWLIQHLPMLPYYLSTERRVRFTRSYLGPLGAWWLRDRVEGKVPIINQTTIVAATAKNGTIFLTARSASGVEHTIKTEHIIAGTGYEADVDRLPFINPALAAEIHRVERAPELSTHFESSVPGLYFVGPVAAFSFGPLVRFVAGAPFAVPKVIRHVTRSLKRSSGLDEGRQPSASTAPQPGTREVAAR